MTVIAQKGSYRLIQYDDGLYAVDFTTRDIGITVIASLNRNEVEAYFNNLETIGGRAK
jgi:hypothetical protein